MRQILSHCKQHSNQSSIQMIWNAYRQYCEGWIIFQGHCVVDFWIPWFYVFKWEQLVSICNCPNYLSCCSDKIPWERQPTGERTYLWITVQGCIHLCSSVLTARTGAAALVAPVFIISTPAQLDVSFLCSPGPQHRECSNPVLGWLFLTQLMYQDSFSHLG